jgi:hypothetical protein
VETLVDLTPVSLWSRGDFLTVRPGECPRPGQADYRVAGRDPCYGTRFADALREAGAALGDCAKAALPSQCTILMFTDGDLRRPNDPGELVDSIEKITTALNGLPPGVKVYMIFFGEKDATEPPSSAAWKTWRDPNGRINDWFFNAAAAERGQVYGVALRMLSMEDVLYGLRSVPLPSAAELVGDHLPPNVDRLELNLLPDIEITETFTASWGTSPASTSTAMKTEPDVDEGTRRIWLSPSFDGLTMALAGRGGLAYYRVVTYTVPVQARVAVWPTEVVVGQPVQVQALVSAGGRVLSDSNKMSVMGGVEGGSEKPVPLLPQTNGAWIGPLVLSKTGSYSVVVDVNSSDWQLTPSAKVVPADLRVNSSQREAILRVQPYVQIAGWPVEFEVRGLFDDFGVNLPPTSHIGVTLEPGGWVYSLSLCAEGVWRTVQPITVTGSYTASVVVTGGQPSKLPAPTMLKILPAPMLKTVSSDEGKKRSSQKDSIQLAVPESGSLFLVAELEDQVVDGVPYAATPSTVIEIRGLTFMQFILRWLQGGWPSIALFAAIIAAISTLLMRRRPSRAPLDESLRKAREGKRDGLQEVLNLLKNRDPGVIEKISQQLVEPMAQSPEILGEEKS